MADGLKGMRALVTGAAGFLGHHVCAELEGAGAQVFPAARRDGFDIADPVKVLSAVLLARPDVVIHLAAPPEDAPAAAAVREPIIMGLNVLQACSMAQCKAILVCRNGSPGSVRHAVRAALLAAGRGYRKDHGLRFVQIVPCDMYGPLDHFGSGRPRLVPTLLDSLLSDKDPKAKTPLTFKGHPGRPFPLLYVADATKAIISACSLPGCDEPLELSGPEVPTLEQISTTAAKRCGFGGKIAWEPAQEAWTSAPHDGVVAREILGWEPATGIDLGIQATVDWLRARPARAVPEGT